MKLENINTPSNIREIKKKIIKPITNKRIGYVNSILNYKTKFTDDNTIQMRRIINRGEINKDVGIRLDLI